MYRYLRGCRNSTYLEGMQFIRRTRLAKKIVKYLYNLHPHFFVEQGVFGGGGGGLLSGTLSRPKGCGRMVSQAAGFFHRVNHN